MDQLPLSFGSSKHKRTAQPKPAAPQKSSAPAGAAFGMNAFLQKAAAAPAQASSKPSYQQSINEQHKREEQQHDSGRRQENEDQDDESIAQPRVTVSPTVAPTIAASSSAQNSTEEEEEDLGEFPISKHGVLKAHSKPISALAIDPSGTRMLTGSYDYTVHFWDFAGMDRSLKSFREITPLDGYILNHLAFSMNGDRFAVAMDHSQPKIYDRDGHELSTFNKGYMYITDMRQTTGHIAAVTGIQWSPRNKQHVLTSSVDSSIRVWDVEKCDKQHIQLMRTRNAKGTKTGVTSCTYDRSGVQIAAGCQDGSVQIFSPETSLEKPQIVLRKGTHADGVGGVSSVSFDATMRMVASRGMDHTLKVWDLRAAERGPLKTFFNLENHYAQTDCIFSPDNEYILTGVSSMAAEGQAAASPATSAPGCLMFIERQTLQMVKTLEPSEAPANNSVVRVQWHPLLNQIFVGCSDGNLYGYYDEQLSRKGMLLSMVREAKKKNIDEYEAAPMIVAPLEEKRAHRQQQRQIQKQKEAQRLEQHAPERTEKKAASSVSDVLSNSHVHMFMKNIVKREVDKDPVAALMKYDDKVREDPMFVTPAYQTQRAAQGDDNISAGQKRGREFEFDDDDDEEEVDQDQNTDGSYQSSKRSKR